MKTQTDSEGPLTQVQQQLVVEHYHLAASITRTLVFSEARKDDALSCANEGLVHAARIFAPVLGVPFAAFAAMHIRWAILKGLRADRAARRRIEREAAGLAVERGFCPFAGVIGPDAGSSCDPEALLLQEESNVAAREILATAVAQLRAKDREVVEAHYFEDRELKSLVRKGSSYATIRRRHTGALARLQKRLTGAPIFATANMS